jgi:hypothetical protein
VCEYQVWKNGGINPLKAWMWKNFRGVMVIGQNGKSIANHLIGKNRWTR